LGGEVKLSGAKGRMRIVILQFRPWGAGLSSPHRGSLRSSDPRFCGGNATVTADYRGKE